MNIFKTILIATLVLSGMGCKKPNSAMLHFKVKFDPLQERLNSSGKVVGTTAGRASQSVVMNSIGISNLELLAGSGTKSGAGETLLSVDDVFMEGNTAVDISKVKMIKEGEILISIPFNKIAAGKYEWIRTAVPYQNFDVQVNMLNVAFVGNLLNERGTLVGFYAPNNYISKYKIWEKENTVNGIKKQGYWGFETKFNPAYAQLNKIYTGQTTEGTNTFVNPIYQTSPILNGECIVTGRLDTPLSITGDETEDVTVILSFSVNNSFEWEEEINRNGKWDINAQANTGQPTIEKVVDMGLRGLKASYQIK